MDAESVKTGIDWMPIALALFSGFIGTFFGAYFLNWRSERKISGVRKIAIKCLNKIKDYDKSGKTYKNVEDEFNNDITTAEKRAVLVALQKIGVPVKFPFQQPFNIRVITFYPELINSKEVEEMIAQIKTGNCDHLFFSDPDIYFTENNRIKAMRTVAKNCVNNALRQSYVGENESGNLERVLPKVWSDSISGGEMNVLLVFLSKTNNDSYYNADNKADQKKMDSLVKEIELGLWDTYLQWDHDSFRSMNQQLSVNNVIIGLAESQQLQNLIPPFK
jgi:hypothetical protein